jgi:hypothetical protein
MQGQMVGKIQG